MACKNCEKLQRKLDDLQVLRDEERALMHIESIKSEELQDRVNWYARGAEARKRPTVEELLHVASVASQISKLSGADQASVIDAASAVALAALKQVQERLKGDEPPAPVQRHPEGEFYDIIVDASFSGRAGEVFKEGPEGPDQRTFRVYRTIRAAFRNPSNDGKKVRVMPGVYSAEGL